MRCVSVKGDGRTPFGERDVTWGQIERASTSTT